MPYHHPYPLRSAAMLLAACAFLLLGLASPVLALEYDTDRPGNDYANFDLSSPDPKLCRKACRNDPRCVAFTYVKPGIQGPNPRCWLKDSVPTPVPSPCCVSGLPNDPNLPSYFEQSTNRPGNDYDNFSLPSPDPQLCRQRCLDDPNCRAFTYVKPGVQGEKPRCWLKSAVPNPVSDSCCVSGVSTTNSNAFDTTGLELGTDRMGADYDNFSLPSPDPQLCRQRCLNDPNCRSFTYVKPGVQGDKPRCYLKNSIPNPKNDNCCISGLGNPSMDMTGLEMNTDRFGHDYNSFDMAVADPQLCRQACLNDPNCRAFTYTKPGEQGPNPRCYLKNSAPNPKNDNCCISGIGNQPSNNSSLELNTDRPGNDFKDFDLAVADPQICRQACLNDPFCVAFTYVKPGFQGPNPHCWLKDGKSTPVPSNCCVSGVNDNPASNTSGLEFNMNRPGKDYADFDLSAPDPNLCLQACRNDSNCRSFTYVKPGYQGPNPHCWLKKGIPDAKPNDCCVSGLVY